jgi:ubiquinone/menaquinone biosynthesis C-methylase UbiE
VYNAYSTYQDKGNRIIKYLLKFIKLNDKVVLELGCGSGMYTGEIAKRCKILYAIDNSLPLLKIAKSKYKKHINIQFIHADITSIPLDDKSVDLIFSTFAYPPYGLENKCEKEVERILKTEGQIWHVNNYPSGEFMKLRGLNESKGKKDRQRWYKQNGYILFKVLKTGFNFPDYKTGAKLFIEVFGDEVKKYISTHTNLNITRHVSIHTKMLHENK